MRNARTGLLVIACALVATTAPAGAVVGGEPVAVETVPWFAEVNGCGGVLVAPDRVLTAAHCVHHAPLANLAGVSVGTELRRGTRYAMHPGWRRANGTNVLDDVALVALDAPVTTVAPVAVGGPPWTEAWILGRGRPFAPGTGHSEGETFDSTLRQAVLRPMGDKQCAAVWKHRRGNGGERFDPARMLCAIDVDGLEPLSSGCNGDSSGPLYAGTAAAPVLLGLVSWGGTRCGADHTPSVFAEVARYRDFITDPSPTWAPAPTSAAKVTGSRRVGGTLRCAVDGYVARPTKVEAQWQRQGGRPNDGGISTAAFAPTSMVKIPR
jgi:Trypsin